MTALLTRRADRVYRVVVDRYPDGATLPDGTLDWTWEPPDWEDQVYYPGSPDDDLPRFRWPALRRCLSLAAAQQRAGLYKRYGATVHIEASAPLDWSEPITLPVPDLPPEPEPDRSPTFPPIPDGSPF